MVSIILFVLIFSGVTNAADTTVTKAEFVERMKTALANSFCGDKMYFRKCFEVSEDDCISETLRATKVCLASIDNELPAKLHQPADGKKYGTKVGACTGTNYELALRQKKINSPDCNDISKWK